MNRNISLKWSYWLASALAVLEVELKVHLAAGSVGMKQSILPWHLWGRLWRLFKIVWLSLKMIWRCVKSTTQLHCVLLCQNEQNMIMWGWETASILFRCGRNGHFVELHSGWYFRYHCGSHCKSSCYHEVLPVKLQHWLPFCQIFSWWNLVLPPHDREGLCICRSE